jgi:hypothetical protein
MLWQQPRIAALGSDVDESKRARGYGREAERRARDLPATFPMRTVNDEGVGYLSVPGQGCKGSFNPLLDPLSRAFKLKSGLRADLSAYQDRRSVPNS